MEDGDAAMGRDVLRAMAGVPEYKTVTLNKYLAAVVEDLVKIANCKSGAEQYCAIPFKIVIRRGAVDFIVKSGRISVRRNVVNVETGDDSVMVDGDFGTVSLIRNRYSLLQAGEKVTWDGTELTYTASEFVKLVKEYISEIISREI